MGQLLRVGKVTILSDNFSTVTYLQKGTAKNLEALGWLKHVLDYWSKHDFYVSVRFFSGSYKFRGRLIKLPVRKQTSRCTFSFTLSSFVPLPYDQMLSAIQLRNLETAATKLRDSAMADSTKQTRTSNWNQFLNFCKQFELLQLPASPLVLTLLVTHLAQQGLEYFSILNYLHSLSALYTTRDLPPPV